MKQKSIILCNTNRGCCPVMTIKDDDTIQIKDDDNNIVTMNVDQAKLIGDKLKELLSDTE